MKGECEGERGEYEGGRGGEWLYKRHGQGESHVSSEQFLLLFRRHVLTLSDRTNSSASWLPRHSHAPERASTHLDGIHHGINATQRRRIPFSIFMRYSHVVPWLQLRHSIPSLQSAVWTMKSLHRGNRRYRRMCSLFPSVSPLL